MARGNYGNRRQHEEAGQQSSGNPHPSKEAQRKGGENSHKND
jgi:hypothetical protein